MCEPTTLAVASLASTVMAGYMQYQGQKQAADNAAAMAEYDAAVARNNMVLAERAAVDAEDRGRIAAREERARTRQLIARQRVGFAANGVRLGTGSTLDIMGDAAAFGELDALTAINNSQREALNYRQQGANFRGERDLAFARRETAQQAGRDALFSTALNTAGSVASKWYTYDSEGALDFGWGRKKPSTAYSSYVATARF